MTAGALFHSTQEVKVAKYAPVYMTVYDGPEGALVDLVLAPATFVEASAEDTAIGSLTGMMAGSELSLIDDAGGKVKLNGSDLVVGATASAVADSPLAVTVRETNLYGSNNPHDTALSVAVTAA
jgi:hypothetical protein